MAIPQLQLDTATQAAVTPTQNPSVTAVNPQQVYAAGNVSQTVTSPVSKPDLSDLLGIREQLKTELNIPSLQKEYQNIYGQLNKFDSATEKQLVDIENQPLSMNVIRGEQARAGQLNALSRSAIARELDVKANALQAAQMELGERFAIRQQEVQEKKSLILQYPGAKISFADDFSTVEKKLVAYQEKLKKDAEKESYKEALRSMGLSTKGSRGELEKRLTKANKSAKKQADEAAELQLEQLRLSIANTKSIMANRNTSSTIINPASLYGDEEDGTTPGGMSTNPNNQPVSISYWDYLNK